MAYFHWNWLIFKYCVAQIETFAFFFLISSGELANGDDTDKGRPSNRR